MKIVFSCLLVMFFTGLLLFGSMYAVIKTVNSTDKTGVMDYYIATSFLILSFIIGVTVDKWVKKILEIKD